MDVFVPLEDGRIDVYQVKRFDRPLTASQWRKVKDSYDTLAQAVADGHFSVRAWYLTMPLDASNTDELKFANLTGGRPVRPVRVEGAGLAGRAGVGVSGRR